MMSLRVGPEWLVVGTRVAGVGLISLKENYATLPTLYGLLSLHHVLNESGLNVFDIYNRVFGLLVHC